MKLQLKWITQNIFDVFLAPSILVVVILLFWSLVRGNLTADSDGNLLV